MNAREPRFEIVRSDAGWHARFRAANGRVVWATEVYQRRGKAVHAIELITFGEFYASPFQAHPEVRCNGGRLLEVHDVDETGAAS